MNLPALHSFYKSLSLKLQDELFRVSIKEQDLTQAISCLETLSGEWRALMCSDSLEFLLTIKEIFRCLRNACISCVRNQNIIRKSSAISVTLNIIQNTLEENSPMPEVDNFKNLQIVCIQFLGNLVTGNCFCQELVWSEILPKVAVTILERLESSQKDLFCMVIFNCIRQRPNFIEENNVGDLMLRIIDHCKESDAEWGLFIMEHIISSGNFIELYEKIADFQEHRLVLLDLLLAFLDGETLEIPERSIFGVADLFEFSAGLLTDDKTESDEDFHKTAKLVVFYLKILCASTAFRNKYENLLKKSGLLEQTIHLLKAVSINTGSKKAGNFDSNNSNVACSFKKYLVRLIGNMCYDMKENQDLVRQLGGIPAILNNFRIDDINPYICQWATFTVRNLCKDNIENQTLISSFESQGLLDSERLREQGIEASLENGRIRVKMGKRDVDNST